MLAPWYGMLAAPPGSAPSLLRGPGGGASKLTGDMTQIMAQLPPIIESLTGIKFEKLLEQVPGLKQSMAKPEGEGKK